MYRLVPIMSAPVPFRSGLIAKRGEEMFMENTTLSTQSEPDYVAKLRHMASEFAECFNTGVDRIMRFYGDP